MKINNLEQKIQVYREWLVKNPPIIDENTGYEMKECEGCYCQMFADGQYDFCFDCLDCEEMGCNEYQPDYGNCCACFGKKQGNPKLKRKPLTFSQQQRLHWEQIKQKAEDRLEKIKDYEDPNDMLTAKRIENAKRWTEQEKQRILKNLSLESR